MRTYVINGWRHIINSRGEHHYLCDYCGAPEGEPHEPTCPRYIKPVPDDELLHQTLIELDIATCRTCGRTLDRGDIAWNESSTEAGTPCSTINITCQACDTEALHMFSWYPGPDDLKELVYVLETDGPEAVEDYRRYHKQ